MTSYKLQIDTLINNNHSSTRNTNFKVDKNEKINFHFFVIQIKLVKHMGSSHYAYPSTNKAFLNSVLRKDLGRRRRRRRDKDKRKTRSRGLTPLTHEHSTLQELEKAAAHLQHML